MGGTLYTGYAGADTGFPEREGGGVKTFTSTHTPLGHCPRDVIKLKNAPTLGHSQAPPLDIVRVTSSALRKMERNPHSWTFTSTPPLGHYPCDVIHIPRWGGGGDRSRPRTLCIGFQYWDKFKGGGGVHPCHTHSWIRHWYGWAVYV